MIKVSMVVRSGTARFTVTVQAESIERAMSIVGSRPLIDEVRVRFPIDPEAFFVKGDQAGVRVIDLGLPERKTAEKRWCKGTKGDATADEAAMSPPRAQETIS